MPKKLVKSNPKDRDKDVNSSSTSLNASTPTLSGPQGLAAINPSATLAPNPSIPNTYLDGGPLPAIIVFDLDYTLWPFWVDTHVSGPLKPATNIPPNSRMTDRWGESFSFYADVPSILYASRQRGITMSLASRTHAPDLAREMLRGIHIPPLPLNGQTERDREKPAKAIEYFSYPQIFPGNKTTHFRNIQSATAAAAAAASSGVNSSTSLSSTMPNSKRQGLVVNGSVASLGAREVPFADMLFFDDEARNRNVETELGVTFWMVRDGVTRDEVDKGVKEWRRRRRTGV